MYKFNKKQKIILLILAGVIMFSVGYYVYSKEENFENIETNEEIEERNQNNKSNETILKKDIKIIVHISGAVNKEGIIEIEQNSRVADVIEKAGGLKENANLKEINLASKIEDGMKIYIPNKNEQLIENNSDKNLKSNNEKKLAKVNINTATQEELDKLPGIGLATAQKIIDYRKEKGTFSKIEELKEVSGIGDAKFDKLKDLITVTEGH